MVVPATRCMNYKFDPYAIGGHPITRLLNLIEDSCYLCKYKK